MTNISKEAPRCTDLWNLFSFEKLYLDFILLTVFCRYIYLHWNFGVTLLCLGKTVSNGLFFNVCYFNWHQQLDKRLSLKMIYSFKGLSLFVCAKFAKNANVRTFSWNLRFLSHKINFVTLCFRPFYQKKKNFFLRNQEIFSFLCVLDPGDHFTKSRPASGKT